MNMEHDHVVSKTLFRSLPKVRRLPAEYQEKVKKYMNLQVNKRLLREEIIKETGKNVTLKDLSNIAAKGRDSSGNFEEILTVLQNDHHCSVSVLKDNDSILQGLFFQDKEMSHMYKSYPEVMFFDETYTLINYNFTCYIFLIEDGNGSGEIVGVGLLAHQDKESVRWLIGAFQEENDEWPKTRIILIDKEFTERVVFTDMFPNAQLEICLFHTFKKLRREITPDKMGVSKKICDTAKEYLTKLAFCQSEESYSSIYESFKNAAPSTIMNYYNDNWHNIRKEWTSINCINGNFLNMANTRLESVNKKLKSIIRKFCSFSGFIGNLFFIIRSMRQERDDAVSTDVLKISSTKFPAGCAEESYQKLLNPYPFDLVLKQLNMSADPKTTTVDEAFNYSYESQGNWYPVNTVSCQCAWYNSMKLPCRHILSVRRKFSISTFDPSLCDKRWLKTYLIAVHSAFNKDTDFEMTCEIEQSDEVPETTEGRYVHIFSLMQRIAAVAADSTGSDFLEKENALKNMLNLWEKGQKVTVCAVVQVDDAGTAIADNYEHFSTDCNEVEIVSSSVQRETGTQFTNEMN